MSVRRNSHISVLIADEPSDLSLNLPRRRSAGHAYGDQVERSAATLEAGELRDVEEPQSSTAPAAPAATRQTPLPKTQMLVVCLVTFVEPLQFGVILPFIYFMVQDFFPTLNHASLGTYVGLITSAFCIAQLFTALPWGLLSDRIGRKPVLLIGLTGNAIFMLLFGVARKYWQAIVFRTLCGALNGNIGIVKAMIGEITDDSNRTLAFSLWETAFGLGAIAGPMIGGLLTDPTRSLAFLFRDATFLAKKPYFLPCAACGFFSIIGIFLTLWLPETLKAVVTARSASKHPQRPATSTATLDPAEAASHPPLMHRGSGISVDELPPSRASIRSLMTAPILLPATAYGLWALIQVFFDETLAIYAVAPRGAGLRGLGLTSRVLGLVLAATGVLQVFAQAVMYPPCQRRIGVMGCLKVACVAMAVFVGATGFVGDVAARDKATAAWLTLALTGRTVAIVFGYISIMLLINDSAPSPSMLGTVHGIGQMACSAARAVGPAFAGVLFTHSAASKHSFPLDYHLPFLLMTVLALICGAVAIVLSRIIK